MLELGFDISPDANGIIDGRELAHTLIGMAYALLAPYVNVCPACADAIFSTVANSAIEELQREAGGIPGKIMNTEDDADGARWRKHVAETKALTKALLGTGSKAVHIH